MPNGDVVVKMLPESYIEMMAEIHDHHETLWPIVQGAKDLGTQLEEIAVYVNVPLQGRYGVAELCRVLKKELERARRGGIILLH